MNGTHQVAVMYLAAYLTKKEDRLTGFFSGLMPALFVVAVLGGLVLLGPDLGTVVVMGSVAVGLLFLGGARISHLLSLGLCAVPAVVVLVLGSNYRRQRLVTFLAPWKNASDTGFQITQSFLAFGSGGLFGVGLGEGKQKLFFLPEAHTDFVLALVGEELGLVGTGVIILLFALFVVRGFQIAARARMPFGRYLGMGITLLIGIQALINACVVTGLLPTKGLTLPFERQMVFQCFRIAAEHNPALPRHPVHGGKNLAPVMMQKLLSDVIQAAGAGSLQDIENRILDSAGRGFHTPSLRMG